MRPTTSALLSGSVLLALVAGCGADSTAGTLSEDDLPDGVSVSKTTHDVSANQVTCQDVNDAEDNSVISVSSSFEKDKRAAVSYRLEGSGKEYLANSVWRAPDPKAAVAKVSEGLDACVKDYPESYERFDVEGYPDAVGYAAQEGEPTPVFTRRILVPLEDRVVIVSISRQGDDSFSVEPVDLLQAALKASADAPD